MFAFDDGANQTVRTIELADVHLFGPEQIAEALREVPIRTRPAAEQIQTERAVFGKRVAGEVRFRQHADAGHAARLGELMPLRRFARMEVEIADQPGKKRLERREIAEAIRRTAVGFDDPFDTGHVLGLDAANSNRVARRALRKWARMRRRGVQQR